MTLNTPSRLERQPRTLSLVESEISSTAVRQVRWLAIRFGLSVDQAKVIAGLAFETAGKRS